MWSISNLSISEVRLKHAKAPHRKLPCEQVHATGQAFYWEHAQICNFHIEDWCLFDISVHLGLEFLGSF